MRARTIALLVLAASLPLSCDAVLGFQPGHLPDGGVVDGGQGDGTLAPEGGVDASADSGAGHDASSGDGPAADGPPPWTPASLGSLVLWLDDDVGVTTHTCSSGAGACIKTWADRTSNHNDGYPWAPQAEPLLIPGRYNGHAAVRFDGVGTQLTIADGASLQFQNNRYTIVAVVAEQPASMDGTIYAKTAPSYPYSGPGMWVSYFNQGAGISPAEGRMGTQVDYAQILLSRGYGLDDGVLRLVEADCDGTTLTLRVGDEAPVTRPVDVDAGALTAIGKDAYVGGMAMVTAPSDPQAFLGDMTEVLVANDVLSSTDWGRLSGYLTTKYALASDGGVPEAGPADATAPWTPASLGSSLVVWLRGDRGVTTSSCGANTCVSAWADQSTHGNDATVPAGGTAPLYLPGLYGPGALGFDGATTGTASLAVADSASIQLTGGFTIIAVAFPTGSARVSELYGKNASTVPYAGPFLAVDYDSAGASPAQGRAGAQVDFYNGVASAPGTSFDGALHVFSSVYDGAGQLSLRVDDGTPVVASVAPTDPLTAPGRPAFVGGAPSSTQTFAGNVAEVIVVDAAISSADWTSAYAYLKARYAALPP
jgi:hypothetical protein